MALDTLSNTFHLARNGEIAPARYEEEIRHLKSSEIGSPREVILRQSIVAVMGLLIYFATFDPVVLVWVPLFLVLNFSYYRLLHLTSLPFTMGRYLSLNASFVIASTVFTFMPIYLWTTVDDYAVRAAAIFAVLGHGIFSLCHHTRRTFAAFWDNILVLASIGAVSLYEASMMDTLAQQAVMVVGGASIMFYYVLAHHAAISDREALASYRVDALEDLKIAAMGQITAGVAHDFNNKLTVIQGNIDLAALTDDPIERAERLAEARGASELAAEVVAHMRAFVRKSPLSPSVIDLDQFGQTFCDALTPYLPDDVRVIVDRDPSVAKIETDAKLLHTALLNLAINAIEAMDGDGGILELRIAPGVVENWSGRAPRSAGPYVRFDICDTGPGLAPARFNIVQEPFFTTKPPGTSAGLGLSMVKGFTEQTGGALMLRNRPMGGLEVSLLLPQKPGA